MIKSGDHLKSLLGTRLLPRKLLVATDLVGAVSAKIGLEEGDTLKVVETFKGKDLVGIK